MICRVVLAGCSIVVVGIAAVTAWMMFDIISYGMEEAMSDLSQAEIEAFVGAEVPQEAVEVHSYSEAALDRVAYLTFFAPSRAVEEFLEQIPVDLKLRDGLNPLASSARDDLPWWTVEGMTNPAGGEVHDYETVHKSYIVTVDRIDDGSWHILLKVFDG